MSVGGCIRRSPCSRAQDGEGGPCWMESPAAQQAAQLESQHLLPAWQQQPRRVYRAFQAALNASIEPPAGAPRRPVGDDGGDPSQPSQSEKGKAAPPHRFLVTFPWGAPAPGRPPRGACAAEAGCQVSRVGTATCPARPICACACTAAVAPLLTGAALHASGSQMHAALDGWCLGCGGRDLGGSPRGGGRLVARRRHHVAVGREAITGLGGGPAGSPDRHQPRQPAAAHDR